MKQESCGVVFDNPVLDTVLLAAQLHGSDAELTLDSLADLYGVDLAEQDRHTALGDSIATAEVFLRLIKLLKNAEINTLRDAVAASQKMVAIRRQQANIKRSHCRPKSICLSGFRIAKTGDLTADLIENCRIINGSGHFPRLAVSNCDHGAAQDLARACFR